MEWRKPSDKKFTDLCIYIDAHIEDLRNPGEFPEVEDRVYNYLWLLVKALAIKKCMFQKFDDYDPYAFYSANRLFFALRKNLENQGKTIKGKEIIPIKSCLNYTKKLLYPMKIEYQREAYREIIDEEFVTKKFDAFAFKQKLQQGVKESEANSIWFKSYLLDSLQNISGIIDKVLVECPFRPQSVEYKRLKMSIMLNCLNSLKTKNRLNAETPTTIVWKLPKSMASYVKSVLKQLYTEIKLEIMDSYELTHVDDDTAEQILNYKEGQDYDYGDQY